MIVSSSFLNKGVTAFAVLFLACISILRAEPSSYEGTLSGNKINAVLEWRADNDVAGILALAASPERKLILMGDNSEKGKLKFAMVEGELRIGTAELVKIVTPASIIWTGTVKFSDGSSGTLELRRDR